MISDLNSLNQYINNTQSANRAVPSAPQDPNGDAYFKAQYDTFANNPEMQAKVVAAYYDYNDPEKKKKREISSAIEQAIAQILSKPDVPTGTENSPGATTNTLTSNIPGTTPITNPGAPTTPQVPAPQGSFGLGNAPGQLFGEGGAFTPDSFIRSLIDPAVGAVSTGIINPAASILKSGAGTVRDLTQGKTLQEALANPENAVENQGQVIQDSGQYQEYLKNTGDPLSDIANKLKPAATIASYAPLPGAGITGFLKQGLASGAAAGFGSSERGQEVGSTLIGGATGLATAPIAYGANKLVGSVINKITGNTPQKILSTIDEAAGASDNASRLQYAVDNLTGKTQKKAFQAIADTAWKEGDDVAIQALKAFDVTPNSNLAKGARTEALFNPDPTNLKVGKYRGVTGVDKLEEDTVRLLKSENGSVPLRKGSQAKAIESLTTELDGQLDTFDDTLALKPGGVKGPGGLVTNIDNELVNKITAGAGNHGYTLDSEVAQGFLKDIRDLGNNPTIKDLNNLKLKIGDYINFERTSLASEPKTQQGLKEIWNVLDDTTKQASPELKNLLGKIETLRTAQPFAAKSVKVGTTIRAPIFGFKIPTGGIVEPAVGLAGRAIGAGTGAPVTNNVGNSALISTLISNLFGGNQSDTSSNSTDTASMGTGTNNSVAGMGLPGSNNTDGPSQDKMEQLRQLLLLGTITGSIDPSVASAVEKLGGSGKAKLSEGGIKIAAARDAAQRAATLLESGNVKSGKTASLQRGVTDFFGTTNDKTTEFVQALSDAKASYRNYLIGAGQTESEAANLADSFFDYSLEPKILKERLKGYIQNLNNTLSYY